MQHTLCPHLTYFTFRKSFNTIIGLVFQFWQQEYWNNLKKWKYTQNQHWLSKKMITALELHFVTNNHYILLLCQGLHVMAHVLRNPRYELQAMETLFKGRWNGTGGRGGKPRQAFTNNIGTVLLWSTHFYALLPSAGI